MVEVEDDEEDEETLQQRHL